jgi:aminoglycoside phosphotransferase (APT) family kinase protein
METVMLSNDEAAQWLHAAFPAHPGWTISNHQPIKSFQQQMDRLTLHWPGTGETAEVIVRVYRSQLSWWTLITPDLPEREHAAWTTAAGGGVPVAPVLYRGRVADQHGVVIGVVRGAAHWNPTSTLVTSLAETLARLHGALVDEQARTHLPDCTLPALLLRLGVWVDEIGSEPLRRDLRAIDARLAALREQPAVLIHGDCHPGNILVEGDRVTAMVDWEEAGLGDPRIDICWLAAALRRHDTALSQQFLDRYVALTGFTTDELQLWGEFLEVRYQIVRAWIMHALAQGRALPSANPEAWPE